MISLLQSSNDSHLTHSTHSNYLYTISSMFRLWKIQQLSIRASWFVTRNHEYLVIAKESIFWVNRSWAVQRGIRHINACMTPMTSMRWLPRRPDNGLRNSKQIYHKSMNFTLIWLQICTVKMLISKIHSDSSSINIPTNFKHNCWWICRFSGLSVYPITAWKPTTDYKPDRLKLEKIGS